MPLSIHATHMATALSRKVCRLAQQAEKAEQEPSTVTEFILFPNPATANLTVYCPRLDHGTTAGLELHDTKGALALTAFMTGQWHKLDVSHLSGLYNVVIREGDVLIGGPFGSDWSETWLLDIVVDSIVSVTNLGVTVTRHYVHEVTFWNLDDSSPYNFFAWRFYWQEGMGTSHGLILRMELALGGYYGLSCAVVSDSVVFNHFETPTPEPWGVLPGGQACCSPLNVGITNAECNAASGTSAYPNPSSGLFRLWGMAGTKDVLVFDPKAAKYCAPAGKR